MLSNWSAIHSEYLSIIYHERGKYYCVVNDEFLSQDEYIPSVEHTRLMIRVTLKELKTLCTYYSYTQTSLEI